MAIVLEDIIFLGTYYRLVLLEKLERVHLLITIIVFVLLENGFLELLIVLVFLFF